MQTISKLHIITINGKILFDNKMVKKIVSKENSSEEEKPITDLETDEELKKRYEKIMTQSEELRRKCNEIFKLAGMDRDAVRQLFGNSANFTDEEWEKLQETKNNLEEQLASSNKKVRDFFAKKPRGSAKRRKKRVKGKFLGARKGWLSVE